MPRPTDDGARMPGEFEPHAGCLVAWPVAATATTTWLGLLDDAMDEYARVVEAVAAFEPVTLVVEPGGGAAVTERLGAVVDVVELPIDDAWMRDSGPIFVVTPAGELVALDFRFNAWGGRGAFALDDAMPARLASTLGVAHRRVDLVLEGGAIALDGAGTLVTTEQCLLNPNRNPTTTRAEIEHILHHALGVEAIIWLPVGASEMSVTDGHVDGVCAFVAPGRIVVQTTHDPNPPSFGRLQRDLEALRRARDASGRQLDVIELPNLPLIDSPRGRVPVLPVNFYLCNGGAVVPVSGSHEDEANLAVLEEALPGRRVGPVPGRALAVGGGGVHCITQQIPLGGRAATAG